MKKIFIIMFSAFFICNHNYESQKKQMIDLLIQYGIKNQKVISTMNKINRHEFVPERYKIYAYEDTPLPIGYGQTISQPYMVALMTELLEIQPEDKILEIGTGSGYQAAILGELAKEVVTIEIVPELCESSKKLLKKMNYHNIMVICGDGYKGYKSLAPYDKIILTAAPPELPEELILQLKTDGILVAPIGNHPDNQYLYKFIKEGQLKIQKILPVRFVPMVKME